MIVSMHHEGRVYRIECPDGCRTYANPPPIEDCLVIPSPEHPDDPAKHTYILMPFAIDAARDGRHGLRLLDETEAAL
jgi:hypothetical protein